MNTILHNLQARLDRMALAQLRDTAAQQAEEIERLRDQLAAAERRADWADEAAEMWREDVNRLEEQLQPGQHIGMHQTGELSIVQVTA